MEARKLQVQLNKFQKQSNKIMKLDLQNERATKQKIYKWSLEISRSKVFLILVNIAIIANTVVLCSYRAGM